MAGTIYATMRNYDKKLHKFSESVRAKSEKQAEIAASNKDDPVQLLRITGIASRVFHDIDQYKAIEAQEGLVPWNNKEDNLIDRFDCRSLLDFYREPIPRAPEEKTDEEIDFEEKLAYESYRDLIKLLAQGESEEESLAAVEKKEIERRAAKAFKKTNAGAKAQGQGHAQDLRQKTSVPAGTGSFANVGFSYEESTEAKEAEDGDGSDAASSSESENSEDDDDPNLDLNSVAREYFDIDDFDNLLEEDRREREEQEEAKPKIHPQGTRRQRRQVRRRNRNLETLNITMREIRENQRKLPPPDATQIQPPPAPVYRRRSSPTYDAYRERSRERRRSRSRSPPLRTYITTFAEEDGGGRSEKPGAAAHEERAGPAGPAARHRSSGIIEAIGFDPARKPYSGQHESTYAGGASGASASGSAPAAAAPRPKAAAAAVKESPMERLKRLTAARLNKQSIKDTVKETEKVRQVEKEREFKRVALQKAREEEERAWRARQAARSPSRSRSPSPVRRRSRSPPARPRPRSRSRSRSRSPRRDKRRSRSPPSRRDRDRERDRDDSRRDERSRHRSRSPRRDYR